MYHKVKFLLFTGVQDANGNYLVGGHLGGNQVKEAAGTVINYQHQVSKRGKDGIIILKPTNAVLRIMVSKK